MKLCTPDTLILCIDLKHLYFFRYELLYLRFKNFEKMFPMFTTLYLPEMSSYLSMYKCIKTQLKWHTYEKSFILVILLLVFWRTVWLWQNYYSSIFLWPFFFFLFWQLLSAAEERIPPGSLFDACVLTFSSVVPVKIWL